MPPHLRILLAFLAGGLGSLVLADPLARMLFREGVPSAAMVAFFLAPILVALVGYGAALLFGPKHADGVTEVYEERVGELTTHHEIHVDAGTARRVGLNGRWCRRHPEAGHWYGSDGCAAPAFSAPGNAF